MEARTGHSSGTWVWILRPSLYSACNQATQEGIMDKPLPVEPSSKTVCVYVLISFAKCSYTKKMYVWAGHWKSKALLQALP